MVIRIGDSRAATPASSQGARLPIASPAAMPIPASTSTWSRYMRKIRRLRAPRHFSAAMVAVLPVRKFWIASATPMPPISSVVRAAMVR